MSYTASGNIERIKLKAWASTSGSLSDGQLLELLDDAQRSYIVPLLKSVRDEWFVKGTEDVTPDSSGRIAMPDSVASTVRLVWWLNNGQPVPLPRVEPEASFAYARAGAGTPCGYVVKGYELQILPPSVGSVSIRIEWMERPAEMVLDESAGEIESHASLALTLSEVPLAWQEETPDAVDLISNVSPFSAVAEDVTVASLAGSVLTLSGISGSLIEDGFWVSDVGTTPFPNIPIELHPLLQQSVITTLYTGLGDKRLTGAVDLQKKMEMDLRKTLSPRTQGSARPILNPNAPGMRFGRGWWGW